MHGPAAAGRSRAGGRRAPRSTGRSMTGSIASSGSTGRSGSSSRPMSATSCRRPRPSADDRPLGRPRPADGVSRHHRARAGRHSVRRRSSACRSASSPPSIAARSIDHVARIVGLAGYSMPDLLARPDGAVRLLRQAALGRRLRPGRRLLRRLVDAGDRLPAARFRAAQANGTCSAARSPTSSCRARSSAIIRSPTSAA